MITEWSCGGSLLAEFRLKRGELMDMVLAMDLWAFFVFFVFKKILKERMKVVRRGKERDCRFSSEYINRFACIYQNLLNSMQINQFR